MVVAAIVEVVGLGEVRRMNLYTSTDPVPMSVFWLVPQYFIIGAAEICVNIGTLEMFYSEVTHSYVRKQCPRLCAVYAHGPRNMYACLGWCPNGQPLQACHSEACPGAVLLCLFPFTEL